MKGIDLLVILNFKDILIGVFFVYKIKFSLKKGVCFTYLFAIQAMLHLEMVLSAQLHTRPHLETRVPQHSEPYRRYQSNINQHLKFEIRQQQKQTNLNASFCISSKICIRTKYEK